MAKKKKVKKVVAKLKPKSQKLKISKKKETASKEPQAIQPAETRELPPQPVQEVAEVKAEPREEPEVTEEIEAPAETEETEEESEPETRGKAHRIVIGEAIEFGWNSVKSHLGFFIGVFLLFAALSFMISNAHAIGTRIVLGLLVSGMSLGYIKVAIDIADKKSPEFKELFSCFSLLLKYLIALVLYTVVVSVGLALFVIPGIIWAVQFGFYPFVIVKERMWPLAALRKSSNLTSGVKGRLITFALALFGINLLGVIALGIGIIVTIPLSIIAAAHVFRQLEKNA